MEGDFSVPSKRRRRRRKDSSSDHTRSRSGSSESSSQSESQLSDSPESEVTKELIDVLRDQLRQEQARAVERERQLSTLIEQNKALIKEIAELKSMLKNNQSPATTSTLTQNSNNIKNQSVKTDKKCPKVPEIVSMETNQSQDVVAARPKPSQVSPTTNANEKTHRPPPIFLKSKEHWPALSSNLVKKGLNSLQAKNSGEFIRIAPKSPDEYRFITSALEANKSEYHSYALKEDRLISAVIRNVPEPLKISEIKEDLQEQGFTITEIHRLTSRKTKNPMPLILVKLTNTPKSKEIFNIDSILKLKIKVEAYKKATSPSQCYRCQRYGHSSKMCNNAPRCLKCAKAHLTRECTKAKDTPATCANCGAAHPSSYRGCPAFQAANKPKLTKNAATPSKQPQPVFRPAPPPPAQTRSYTSVAQQQQKPRAQSASAQPIPQMKPPVASAMASPMSLDNLQNIFSLLAVNMQQIQKVLELVAPAHPNGSTK